MEKTINKHHEIVESIKELSNGLLDLEAKLQVIRNVKHSYFNWYIHLTVVYI